VTLSIYVDMTAEAEDDAPDRLDALLTSAAKTLERGSFRELVGTLAESSR